MLKKIVLVAALATASFVSVNAIGRARSTNAPSSTVTMKYPPCTDWWCR
jgi:hypothetical protein